MRRKRRMVRRRTAASKRNPLKASKTAGICCSPAHGPPAAVEKCRYPLMRQLSRRTTNDPRELPTTSAFSRPGGVAPHIIVAIVAIAIAVVGPSNDVPEPLSAAKPDP